MALSRITLELKSLFRRFKLTILFTLVLVGGGFVFRSFLIHMLNDGVRTNMNTEWATLKGVLRIKNGLLTWSYDREDTDEAHLAAKLMRVFLIANPQGSVIQMSETYAELGEGAWQEIPENVLTALVSREPSWRVQKDTKGADYLIRSGVVYSQDASRVPYFVAIGHPLAENQRIVERFTQLYIGLTTIVLLGAWLVGRRNLGQPFRVA